MTTNKPKMSILRPPNFSTTGYVSRVNGLRRQWSFEMKYCHDVFDFEATGVRDLLDLDPVFDQYLTEEEPWQYPVHVFATDHTATITEVPQVASEMFCTIIDEERI